MYQISLVAEKDISFEYAVTRKHTRVANCASLHDLAEKICNFSWCPIVFNKNYLLESNFKSAGILVFNIDGAQGDLSIEEAKYICRGYRHIIATTKNHQHDEHGKADLQVMECQ